MQIITRVMALVLVAFAFVAQAQEEAAVDGKTAVKNKIENMLKMDVISVTPSPVDGLYQAMTERGLFYISADGKYFVHGRIFNLDEGMRNMTEEALSGARLDGLKAFENDMIVFKAKDEKYSVTVFTDITCGYCRKLHNEMEEYNKRGITVRYLAFPRGGPQSQGFSEMQSVWCAKDKQAALTAAKNGGEVEPASCDDKVHEEYMFGQQVGVTGTPAIVLADGTMMPGYQPAAQLEQVLSAM